VGAAQLFNSSAIARYRVLGIPAITLVSIPAGIFLAWQVVLYWNDPLVAGHSLATVLGLAVGFGAGIVSYIIIRVVRTRQGINLKMIFKELPIE
jgi:hypothetical protein